jgi:hypothetical protein
LRPKSMVIQRNYLPVKWYVIHSKDDLLLPSSCKPMLVRVCVLLVRVCVLLVRVMIR